MAGGNIGLIYVGKTRLIRRFRREKQERQAKRREHRRCQKKARPSSTEYNAVKKEPATPPCDSPSTGPHRCRFCQDIVCPNDSDSISCSSLGSLGSLGSLESEEFPLLELRPSVPYKIPDPFTRSQDVDRRSEGSESGLEMDEEEEADLSDMARSEGSESGLDMDEMDFKEVDHSEGNDSGMEGEDIDLGLAHGITAFMDDDDDKEVTIFDVQTEFAKFENDDDEDEISIFDVQTDLVKKEFKNEPQLNDNGDGKDETETKLLPRLEKEFHKNVTAIKEKAKKAQKAAPCMACCVIM